MAATGSAGRVELRLRGITRSHVLVTFAAAAPMVNILYQWQQRGAQLALAWWMWAGCAVVLALPWAARGLVRALHRPAMDEHGVFLGERAIPFAKIDEVVIGRKGRRRYLFLRRGKQEEICLLLEDPYAGKLTPLLPLAERLHARLPEELVVRRRVAAARGEAPTSSG